MKNAVEIKDANDPRVDAYFHLTSTRLRAKNEPEKGIFIAEAQTVIEVALEEGCFPLSVLYDRELLNARAERVIDACRAANPALEVYFADRALLCQMTGFELTRGLLAAMRRPPERDAKELVSSARRVALLEGIADSANVGAILRSSAALGIDAVLLTKNCCDPYLRRCIRVSMGTVFKQPWAYIDDAQAGLALLREYSFLSVAMALSPAAIPLDDERLKNAGRLAILLGTEGDGLKKQTIAACDCAAIIPMHRHADSLNVAAAAAIAFWELRTR